MVGPQKVKVGVARYFAADELGSQVAGLSTPSTTHWEGFGVDNFSKKVASGGQTNTMTEKTDRVLADSIDRKEEEPKAKRHQVLHRVLADKSGLIDRKEEEPKKAEQKKQQKAEGVARSRDDAA